MVMAMATVPGMVYYAKYDDLYILKFVGEIRYTMGCALEKFLEQLFTQRDFDTILIDLTEATNIDSTNLGLLAKAANFMATKFAKKVPIISTNPDVTQILNSVSFDQVFDICDDTAACKEAAQCLVIEDPSKAEMAKTLFEAHSTLSDLSEKNRAMFKNVVDVFKQSQTLKS